MTGLRAMLVAQVLPDNRRMLKVFERAGFEVLSIAGKTIIPVRQNKHLLTYPDAVARLIRLEDAKWLVDDLQKMMAPR